MTPSAIAIGLSLAAWAGAAAGGCPDANTRSQGFAVTFEPASTMRVLRYVGDDVVYESVQGTSKPVEIVSRHGLFVKQVDGSFGTNQFDYNQSIDTIPTLMTGARVAVTGTITRTTGMPQTFEWTLEGGASEDVTIGACRLRGINITRTNVIDGSASRLQLLFIPGLMIPVRMTVDTLTATGAVKRTQRYRATSIASLVR